MTPFRFRTSVAILLALAATLAYAHEHQDVEWTAGNNFANEEEMDSKLKWHIAMQTTTWGLLFPAGMILGLNKSKWHAPLQATGCVLALIANSLGHHHGGRAFHSTAHSHFASYLKWYLILQASLGIFLKLHVLEGTLARRIAVVSHGVVGKTFVVAAWVQMLFGGIAALGFCFQDHLGQCAAHFIMGSGFIGYAVIMLLMLRVGAPWLSRRRVSQEFVDSAVIMVWGIVNTFTEHNPGHFKGFSDFMTWSMKDKQHTTLGVLWAAGGALGLFLSRGGKRNIVPALIISMTGFAMSAHAQELELSTSVHKIFGWSLMSAGAARLIEICFVLHDEPSAEVTATTGPRAFQHLPPFLLVVSGLTFLSATEEQMMWIASTGTGATTYANLLFSTSFVIYLTVAAMLELFERTRPSAAPKEGDQVDLESGRTWWGISVPFGSMFPGAGRSLGERAAAGDSDHYESLPLTASNNSSAEDGMLRDERHEAMNRSVFELGEEAEDGGGDDYWQEREKRERRSVIS